MIAKANTHNSGARLAAYLMKEKDGQKATLYELRGFEALDIKDAFRDIDIMAAGTRIDQPFFHLQVRLPDGEKLNFRQWEQIANRIEQTLRFEGQPRAIVFHTSRETGDTHMHIAWSRIDEQTMKAKAVPFFKLALKEVTKDLEHEFGLTEIRKEREGPIRYAPTKAEAEQARRLGVDADEIRNNIRECWDRSKSGKDFDNALAEKGYVLAKGDYTAFVVLDHAGGVHAIGKRLLNVPATKVHQQLSGLSIPNIEQAREQILDIHGHVARLQLDLAEIDSLISLHKLRASAKDIDDTIANPAKQKEPRNAPEIGRTDGEIRLARTLTDTGREFAGALEDRGFVLAEVSEHDAERLNRWERQRLREIGIEPQGPWIGQRGGYISLTPEQKEKAAASYDRWTGDKDRTTLFDYIEFVQQKDIEKHGAKAREHERFKPGELVVVNQLGHPHQLNPDNTGLSFDELPKYLKEIDRKPLLSVSAADSVMQKFREHGRIEREHDWQEGRRHSINEQHWPARPAASEGGFFADGARDATIDHRTEDLKGVQAKVWQLWAQTDIEQVYQNGSQRTDISEFGVNLARAGMTFATATKDEAARSHRHAAFARETGNYAPRFTEGEIVIVTEPSLEYRRDGQIETPRRVHKVDQSLAAKYVAAAGIEPKSIGDTLKVMDERGRQRAELGDNLRDERSTVTLSKPALKKIDHTIDRLIEHQTPGIGGAGRAAGKLGKSALKPIEFFGDLADSLFTPPETPQQKLDADIARTERQGEAERATEQRERGRGGR
jgi:hypothetical protein